MTTIDLLHGDDFLITITPEKETSREPPEKREPPRKRLSIININGEIVDVED